VITLLPHSAAAALTSNWCSTPPTIDGIIGAGEWDAAYPNSFYVCDYFSGTPMILVAMWTMNDANNLYFRFQWLDSTHDEYEDGFYLYFDEDNNGNWSCNGVENVVSFLMNTTFSTFQDGYATSSGFLFQGIDPISQDGNGSYSYNIATTTYTVELVVPISCVNAEDIQPGAGAIIGISFLLIEGYAIEYYPYPANFTNFGVVTLQLASPPSAIGTLYSLLWIICIVSVFGYLHLRHRRPSISI